MIVESMGDLWWVDDIMIDVGTPYIRQIYETEQFCLWEEDPKKKWFQM
jgi:hypothetical protein